MRKRVTVAMFLVLALFVQCFGAVVIAGDDTQAQVVQQEQQQASNDMVDETLPQKTQNREEPDETKQEAEATKPQPEPEGSNEGSNAQDTDEADEIDAAEDQDTAELLQEPETVLAASTSFAGGIGTQSDPYRIATAAQLALLSQNVKGGNSYANQSFILTDDISLNAQSVFRKDASGVITGVKTWAAVEWIPIGSDATPFCGTMDGNGHSISGIYLSAQEDSQGLFGYLENATIKNLGVVDGYITTTKDYVGGIVGTIGDGYSLIDNCYNTATIHSTGKVVGGIAGYIERGYDSQRTIGRCYNTGTITGTRHVGGILGDHRSDSDHPVTIENCYNLGNISGTEETDGIIGGLHAGYATVTKCYNAGQVTSYDKVATDKYLAGICYPSHEYQFVLTTSELAQSDAAYLLNTNGGIENSSGIWGHNGKHPVLASRAYPAVNQPNGKLSNLLPDISWYAQEQMENGAYVIRTKKQLLGLSRLVNSGVDFSDETVELNNDIDLEGSAANQWEPIGMLNAPFRGTFDGKGYEISGLYWDQSASGLFRVVTNGTIKNLGVAEGYAGTGIVGQLNYGSVENCYNRSVEIKVIDESVGGIVGRNDGGSIIGCYNTAPFDETGDGSDNIGGIAGFNFGRIENCYNTSSIRGRNRVGGIAGTNVGDNGIKSCYSLGDITGIKYVGGITGENKANVENCYNTGAVNGTNYVGGVVGGGGEIRNCYNIGIVNGTGDAVGGIMDYHTLNDNYGSDVIFNCYYLDTCGAGGNGGEALSAKELANTDISYLLNTSNFLEENSGIWGHDGSVPVFANSKHEAVTELSQDYDKMLPDISWYAGEKMVNSAYVISTKEQLLGFSRMVSSGIDNFYNKTVKLSHRIALQ